MFLRNELLWHSDCGLLAAELRIVNEEVEKGRDRLTYTQVGKMADLLAGTCFLPTRTMSPVISSTCCACARTASSNCLS
jgi:hypothetical protein